jgi:ATP-dependent DNA helicase PIF1
MTYVNRKPDSSLIVEPTKLFPLKSMVEHINTVKMNAIVAEEKVYEIKNVTDIKITPTEANQFTNYTEQAIEAELKYLAGNLMCEKEVRLKVGSQVMCIVNIKSETGNGLDICNGSQGLVTSFCPATGYPIVKYNNGIVKMMQRHVWQSEKIPSVGVTQIPLILAWALTIHKSQGASLDAAEIDVGNNVFACGQTYVALSRVKSLDGLYLKSFDVQRIQIDKKVRTYYEGLSAYYEENPIQEEKIVPLVIAEAIQIAQPILENENMNPFVDFQYQEAIVEQSDGV